MFLVTINISSLKIKEGFVHSSQIRYSVSDIYRHIEMHLTSVKQLNKETIEAILGSASDMEKFDKCKHIAEGKILATLFYEPSTRTRMSFESAMLRLGGQVISVPDMKGLSSSKKGETLYDTGKMVSSYADIIAMRHPTPFSVKELSEGSDIPVINAGDGANEHPTQALLDLYTIKKEHGKVDGLNIAFVGDLKYGRTVHSLAFLLKFYDVKLYFVSPDALKMPKDKIKILKDSKIKITELSKLEGIIADIDILYQTRVQEERFDDKNVYEQLKDKYVLDLETIKQSKKSMRILHPLPRVVELKEEVDSDDRAAYFRQAKNAVPVRMAILKHFLFNS